MAIAVTSSLLRNELDIEANKFNSIQMELAEERANVNAVKIELDKGKASVDSLKIDIAQKEVALTEEKRHHNSTMMNQMITYHRSTNLCLKISENPLSRFYCVLSFLLHLLLMVIIVLYSNLKLGLKKMVREDYRTIIGTVISNI